MDNQIEYCWPVRVYYEDTDTGGVVYHARYLHFLERARTEILRENGIDQIKLLEENTAFVVTHVDINYKLPARLDDLLSVITCVESSGAASTRFKQRVVDEQGRCVCEAAVTIACVDLVKHRPIRIPHFIRAKFNLI